MSFTEQTIVARAPAVAPVTEVRSTLIAASHESLKERGLLERYRRALDPAWHERMLVVAAGSWLPIAQAHAHYAACDTLGLEESEVLAQGVAVADRTQQTAFHVLAGLARQAGASPLAALGLLPRLWGRLFVGGGVAATHTGPKDARLETLGLPLLRHAYFRVGLRAVIAARIQPFCRLVTVRELGWGTDELTLSIAWA